SADDYRRIAPEFGADLAETLDFVHSIAARETIGGTAPRAVREQIAQARKLLSDSALLPLIASIA
ncbi:MAG TPA: argininosuccinate lyase, partial [Anaerolineae bacterium]|nr:argininosuccinate lyase [Anaerolineae bacterium]